MADSVFRRRLRQELETRRLKNPRYSVRTFAVFLKTDHSTLSQILRDRRPIPARQIRSWGRKLGMTEEEVAVHVAAQHVPDASISQRQEQLRHWTAEAMAILGDRAHWEILRLARSKSFQPDCRWIASEIGVTVDRVNLALSRLLRLRLLEILPAGRWKVLMDRGAQTEGAFQKKALVRIRELAAQHGVELRSPVK